MKWLRPASIVAALLIVGWVRLLPLSLDGAVRGAENAVRSALAGESVGDVETWINSHRLEFEQRLEIEKNQRRAALSFDTADGGTFPYLGGFDSYVWLRASRNILRHGSACDSIVDGECRDDFTLAPVGVRARYARSFHVAALTVFHRVVSWLLPGTPLSVSGFYLSFFVALLGVFPAYWLGERFGGAIGGFVCAVVVSLNSVVLFRSFGVDNDIWNVVLPLFEVWAIVEAVYAATMLRRSLFVILAALVTGLHAATWAGWIFTSGIVLLGLIANALLWAARQLLHGDSDDSRRGVWHSTALLLAYLVLASLATLTAGAGATPASAARDLVGQVVQRAGMIQGGGAKPADGETGPDDAAAGSTGPGEGKLERKVDRALAWPSVFETVGELRNPSLASIANSMAGSIFFFVAWLGLILLMLPRRDWQSWHFALLIGGNLLYRYLLTLGGLDPYLLATLLLIPLTVGLGAYLADRQRPVEDQGAGATIIVWFLGGLVIAHQGNRFLLLLAPPMAVLCGVAFGRLFDWVARQPWGRRPALRAAAFAVLAATVWLPFQQARGLASNYAPLIDDTWHGALERLREESDADAIVNSWWDYGYFIKYFADRRVLSDGGTLGTQVHHWFSLALMSNDPEESLGILRMLNCGSSALPEPEGAQSAMGRLLASGLPHERAYATVLALASMDRDEAAGHLRDLGLDQRESQAVLSSTHCAPADAYLLLPTSLARSVGWRWLGGQSLVEKVARTLRRNRPRRAAALLAKRFGFSEDQARETLREIERLSKSGARPAYATGTWNECSGGHRWSCRVEQRLRLGRRLQSVELDPTDPAGARLKVMADGGQTNELVPSSVVVASADGLEVFELERSERNDLSELAVLVDVEGQRVLLGTERILRSTFTGLMFLEARYLDRFVEFDRRSGHRGEVITWKIEW